MSLSFTGLEKLEGGQQGIEGFFGNKLAMGGSPIKSEPPVKRQRSSSPSAPVRIAKPSSDSAISEISPRKKPRLPTLHSGSQRTKTGLDSFLSASASTKNGESSSSTRRSPLIIHADEDDGEIINLDDTEAEEEIERVDQWSCPKCEYKTGTGLNEASLKGEKQEHEDFHFAQDLQNGVSPVRSKSVSGIGTGTGSGTHKKKKKVEGIKAFFTAKPVVKKE
jgi:DNA polymerase eta